MNDKLRIGISTGDVNGISLEVVLKTLEDKRILNFCTPVLYGSTKVVSYYKNLFDLKDLTLHTAKDVQSIHLNTVNVVNCWTDNIKIALGQCTEESGQYAFAALQQAVEDLKAGHIDALVTAPINKKAMQLGGFEFPGHTEYLTAKSEASQSLMLLVNEDLRVGLVTNHLPIQQVAANITKESVFEKIQLMNQTLRMDFGIDKPAIAVLGLNPHAGDNGVLGSEEIDIIIPAIEASKAQGILAIGPYAADGFFGSGNYRNFDGILAMYHDQGLVPFKALSFGSGVNFTAGLPFIRTSPDHGTGYDIAGKNIADPQSFREALYLALDAVRQRQEYLELTGNPLVISFADLGDDDETLFDEDDPKNNRKNRSKNSNKRNDSKKPNKKGEKKGISEKIAKSEVPVENLDIVPPLEVNNNNNSEKTVVKEEEKTVKEVAAKEVIIKEPIKKVVSDSDNNPKDSNKQLSVEERLELANKKKAQQQEVKEDKKVLLDDNIIEKTKVIPPLPNNDDTAV